LQGFVSVPIIWLERWATWDYISPLAVASFVLTRASGFWLMTRGSRLRTKIIAAVAYFPLMLALMFLEALYLDVRLNQNNF
jgi:hypothetical protein